PPHGSSPAGDRRPAGTTRGAESHGRGAAHGQHPRRGAAQAGALRAGAPLRVRGLRRPPPRPRRRGPRSLDGGGETPETNPGARTDLGDRRHAAGRALRPRDRRARGGGGDRLALPRRAGGRGTRRTLARSLGSDAATAAVGLVLLGRPDTLVRLA